MINFFYIVFNYKSQAFNYHQHLIWRDSYFYMFFKTFYSLLKLFFNLKTFYGVNRWVSPVTRDIKINFELPTAHYKYNSHYYVFVSVYSWKQVVYWATIAYLFNEVYRQTIWRILSWLYLQVYSNVIIKCFSYRRQIRNSYKVGNYKML